MVMVGRTGGRSGFVPTRPKQRIGFLDVLFGKEKIHITRYAGVEVGIADRQRSPGHSLNEHHGYPGALEQADDRGRLLIHLKYPRAEEKGLLAQPLPETVGEGVQDPEGSQPSEEPDRGPFIRDERGEGLETKARPAAGQVIGRNSAETKGVEQSSGRGWRHAPLRDDGNAVSTW